MYFSVHYSAPLNAFNMAVIGSRSVRPFVVYDRQEKTLGDWKVEGALGVGFRAPGTLTSPCQTVDDALINKYSNFLMRS